MKTIQETVNYTRQTFKDAGIDTPELDTRLLMEAVLDMKFDRILLKYSDNMPESSSKKLEDFVDQRLKRCPVSRILGYNYFWTSKFDISDETLDPRPDTETIIDAVMANYKKDAEISILDLGTGSGCILITLLQEFKNADGLGVDISEDAIEISKKNAETLRVRNRSSFKALDWKKLDLGEKFDVIVSNPPYIENEVIESLEPEVKDYDPRVALSGGDDGLDCYKEIIKLLPDLLCETGSIFFEIGYNQKDKLKELLASNGLSVIETLKDLTGNDRCVVAKWAK